MTHILTTSDQLALDDLINIEVSITSMQVALTDLFRHLGIAGDGFIGMSLGEFGCAYADGGLTLDQTVLASYWIGQIVKNSEPIEGKHAIVDLAYEKILHRLPKDVFVNNHVSDDRVMVAGSVDPVERLVATLTEEGIFANIGPISPLVHTHHMADAASMLSEYLTKIIPNPKNRTSAWISTSFPESEWSTPIAQQCSADYFAQNVISPMFLKQTWKRIPENAICIELAPNADYIKVIDRWTRPDTRVLGLSQEEPNNLEYFLSRIGKYVLINSCEKMY